MWANDVGMWLTPYPLSAYLRRALDGCYQTQSHKYIRSHLKVVSITQNGNTPRGAQTILTAHQISYCCALQQRSTLQSNHLRN